ncbi:MAG: LCP family protein [Oscillospiraceae bacterium]
MSRAHSSRRQRSKLNQRLALVLVLLVAVTLFVGYNKLFQAPEQKTPEDPVLDDSTDTTDLESEALRSHLERKPNFYTILVSGVDDHNGGSDTNILVAVDAENNYIYGVSIPRDTKSIIHGRNQKINYAYNAGGIDLLAQTISDQLGIPVDYTVSVDLQGFVALVDAIGGVTFDVPINMNYEDPYQNLYIHISKGVQRFSGADALKVVHFREGYATQDIGHMETQQNFLKAVAKQVLTVGNLDKIDDFVKIFQTYVETDLTVGNLAWLGKEAIGMGADAMSFSTLPSEWHSPYIYLDTEATLALVNEYLNPYVEDRVAEDLHICT